MSVTTVDSDYLSVEHGSLLDHVEHLRLAALELPSLSPEERGELVGRVVDFIDGDLRAHAENEEQTLYPWIASLLGDPRATDPMMYDHMAIRQMARRLKETDVADVALLQELLYGLHALITVHFDKEEELYLPLLGRPARRRNGGGDD